jgi:hypothetical protein
MPLRIEFNGSWAKEVFITARIFVAGRQKLI